MPGNKNSQDWTDDAAFWDEAWSDMERRLDEKETNPRAGFIWWMGGIALAIMLGGGLSLASQLGWSPTASSLTDSLPTTTTAATNPALTGTTNTPNSSLPAAADSPLLTEEKTIPADVPQGTQPPPPRVSATTVAPTKVLSGPRPDFLPQPTSTDFPKTLKTGATPATEATESESKAAPDVIVPKPIATRKEVLIPNAKPVASLSDQVIRPLPLPKPELPGILLTRNRRAGQLRLEAGGTTGLGFAKTGYYAGLGYQLPSRSKISLAGALRFRRDDIQITAIGPNDQVEAINDQQGTPTNPAAGFDRFAASNALLRDLQISNFDELRTSGLELRIDAGYELGHRLRLMAGAGVEYLFQASGPVITTDSASFADLSGGQAFINLNVGQPVNYELNAVNLGNGGEVVGNSSVYRLAPRAYLGLRYQLTGRVGIEASGSWLLRSIYQEDVAQLQRAQLQVGLSWRLR